jgi:hypothetical protein
MSVSKIIRCVAQLPAFPRPPEGDCAPPPCPTEEPSAPCPAPLPDPCPLKEPEDPCPPKEPPADPCPRQDDSHGYHRQQHSSRRSSEQTRHASAIRAPHGYRESRRDSVYVNTNTEGTYYSHQLGLWKLHIKQPYIWKSTLQYDYPIAFCMKKFNDCLKWSDMSYSCTMLINLS